VTVKVNPTYLLVAVAALLAAAVALQLPEIKRYLKMETM
jgi:hypothetical protein